MPDMVFLPAFVMIVVVGLWSFAYLLRGKGKKRPPGPRGLPLLGSLHRLGEFPYRDLSRLAQTYGPIMYLHLGLVPIVVVSSAQAAHQFLITHDRNFANRPCTEAAKYIEYGRQGIVFAEYGPHWRNIRKWCTLEILSLHKINSFAPMRREELTLLVQSIKDVSGSRIPANLSAKVGALSVDMTLLMMFGKKYKDEDVDEKGFKKVVQEALELTGIFNIADYIPFLGCFDLQGLRRKMIAINKVIDGFLEKIIDEHMDNRDCRDRKDFVDTMISIMENPENQTDRTQVKAILMDMLVAGMDTSPTTVEWVMSELLKHPRAFKKLQEELERVVGMERMVEESDLPNLKYLDMVVKEGMRLHPVAPLLGPHQSLEECRINGFYIPKECRVIINAWAIGRDPDAWEPNPDQFLPERFEATDIDLKGRHSELIPFGAGRRICPGMQLGLTFVRLVVAQLVHCFDWDLPEGTTPEELDMTEKFSLITPRAKPLLTIPTYRIRACDI